MYVMPSLSFWNPTANRIWAERLMGFIKAQGGHYGGAAAGDGRTAFRRVLSVSSDTLSSANTGPADRDPSAEVPCRCTGQRELTRPKPVCRFYRPMSLR